MKVAEDAVVSNFSCSGGTVSGVVLGCGVTGPEVEDAYSDPDTAAANWDAHIRSLKRAAATS